LRNNIQISCFLIDLDGTLIDSEKLYKNLWQQLAKEFNVLLTDEYYNSHLLGLELCKCYDAVNSLADKNFDKSAFIQAMTIRETTLCSNPIKQINGATELLKHLHALKIPIALVTSARALRVKKILAHYYWTDYFDVIISSEDVKSSKPNPECYYNALDNLSLSNKHAWVIEDSNIGAKAAIAAGCHCVLIRNTLDTKIITYNSNRPLLFRDISAFRLWLTKHYPSKPHIH